MGTLIFAYQLQSDFFDLHHQEPSLWPTEPCPSMNSVYSIGRTMFETDRIPEGWPMRLGNMDEIWVPTTYTLLDLSIRSTPLTIDILS